MPADHDSKKHDENLRRGRLLVYGTLLFLICLLLILFRCAVLQSRKDRQDTAQKEQNESGEPGSAYGSSAPSTGDDIPEGWTLKEYGPDAIGSGTLVLVNADHEFDPSSVQPISVWQNKTGSYLVKDVYLSVSPVMMDRLNEWMDDFAAASGLRDVNIVAGWRSREDQQSLYDNASRNKGKDYAERFLAHPGHSEHHTGLAVDLDTYDVVGGTSGGFDGTGDYAWAVEHASEYGFIQRYPSDKSRITGIDYEPWHFRFVGSAHAVYMTQNGLTLEEYVDLLRGRTFDKEHLYVLAGGVEYEIYFCPGTTAIVPEDGIYEVSGNNVDGLIVTVRRQ